MELPGHGMRILESAVATMDELVSALHESLFAGGHDAPYAIFGHSMGALVP